MEGPGISRVERELATLFPGQREVTLRRKNRLDHWTFTLRFDDTGVLTQLEDRHGTIYNRTALVAKDTKPTEWPLFATRDTVPCCVILLTHTYDPAKRGDGVVLSGKYFYDYDLADEVLPGVGDTWAWCV